MMNVERVDAWKLSHRATVADAISKGTCVYVVKKPVYCVLARSAPEQCRAVFTW